MSLQVAGQLVRGDLLPDKGEGWEDTAMAEMHRLAGIEVRDTVDELYRLRRRIHHLEIQRVRMRHRLERIQDLAEPQPGEGDEHE